MRQEELEGIRMRLRLAANNSLRWATVAATAAADNELKTLTVVYEAPAGIIDSNVDFLTNAIKDIAALLTCIGELESIIGDMHQDSLAYQQGLEAGREEVGRQVGKALGMACIADLEGVTSAPAPPD